MSMIREESPGISAWSSRQSESHGEVDPAVAKSAIRRISWRLMPVIGVLYFVAYLDRNNVGFAATDLSRDIGLTASSFGLGAGLFFIGYVLLEVPSNAGMYKWGARRWLSRILISWGVFAAALAATNSTWSFYLIRFLLGAAEAGFFPAILYYFTLWFPEHYRLRILGLFVLAQPLTNAIGAPLSGSILNMNGILGLHGWQWLFIIEGLPAIILGLFVPILLTDRPASARWLPESERDWLLYTLEKEARTKQVSARGEGTFLSGLKDRRFLVYAGLNFGMVFGIYGLGLWLPTIVGAMFGLRGMGASSVISIPYVVAAMAVYPWSWRAAHTGRVAWHASVSLVTGALGLLGAGLLLRISPVLSMMFLCAAAVGIYSAIAPFLSMPSNILTGAAAAAGLAVTNSLGNLGGFLSPYIVGLLKDWTGNDRAGLLVLAACLAITGCTVYCYARNRPEGNLVRPAARSI
jgi:MFS transporter, ACS family, tartrate transporter